MPFPAFREVVGGKGYRELGEPFDDREHKLFGKEAFESVVREVVGRSACTISRGSRPHDVGVARGARWRDRRHDDGDRRSPNRKHARAVFALRIDFKLAVAAATFPHVASALRTVQLRDNIEGQLFLRFAIGEIPKRSARAVIWRGPDIQLPVPRRTSETTPWLPISGRSFRERSSVLSPRNLVQFYCSSPLANRKQFWPRAGMLVRRVSDIFSTTIPCNFM